LPYFKEQILHVPLGIKADIPHKTYPHFNWKAICERSKKFFSASSYASIRSKTIKKFVRIARDNGVRFDDRNVVYVIIHTPTQHFYIGSTSKMAIDRLKEHTCRRTAVHHSKLSQFISTCVLDRKEGFDNFHKSFVCFPIFHAADAKELKQAEDSYIHRYNRNKRLLNLNERFTRHRVANRRNQTNNGYTNLGASSVQPRRFRPSETALLTRLQQMNQAQQEQLLRKVGKRRLRFLLADADPASPIAERIREQIHLRQHQRKQFLFTCRIRFTRRLSTHSLRRIIFGSSFPFPKFADDVRLCVSLNPTIGQQASNASALAIRPRREYLCHCEEIRSVNARLHLGMESSFRQGHIATNDIRSVLAFMQVPQDSPIWKEIQVVWHQGYKFRSAINPDDAVDKFLDDLKTFADSMNDEVPLVNRASQAQISEWMAQAAERYREACSDPRNFIVSEESLKFIRRLGGHFAITCVDKNSQSLAVMCMKEYMKRLQHHMMSDNFEQIDTNNDPQQLKAESLAILRRHAAFNRKFGCTHVDALPYLYIIPKLHKEPARPFDRFIAGNSALNRIVSENQPAPSKVRKPFSSLTFAGRQVSNFLNAIIDLLVLQDQQRIRASEPRRVWIIRDIGDAIVVLRDAKTLFTRDFSTMYQNFPLDKLQNAVTAEVVTALKFACQHYIRCSEDNFSKLIFEYDKKSRQGRWQLGQPSKRKRWGCNECFEALDFLLKNSYFSNVFGLVKQILGVPMGGPHSSPASNLGLAHAERTFVDRTLQLHGSDFVKANYRNFLSYLRYIDDMGSEFDFIPSIDDYYGMELVSTGACPPQRNIDLLAYTFTHRNHLPLAVTLKDKQNKFPLLLCRYPSGFSTLTESCRIGCVIGGLVSIFRVIDSPSEFFDAITNFFDILRARFFTYNVIRTGISRFLKHHCRQQYRSFMMQHFFQRLLSTWPHARDINGDKFVDFEFSRHCNLTNAPSSWRNRFPVISFQGDFTHQRHFHPAPTATGFPQSNDTSHDPAATYNDEPSFHSSASFFSCASCSDDHPFNFL
jgi:hypothetical protein